MEKYYIAKITIVGDATIEDVFMASPVALKEYIANLEANKEIYKRIMIYEEATGDAVYYYSAKKL